MKKILIVGLLSLSSAYADDCLRQTDVIRGTVTTFCTPTQQYAPAILPNAMSKSSPELTFPSSAKPVTVLNVINPVTLHVRYDYSEQDIHLADLVPPKRGTQQYRSAMAYLSSLASGQSILYFEDTGKKDGRDPIGYLWMGSNQLNLLMLENGQVNYDTAQSESNYDDVFTKAVDYAKANNLGIWKKP